MREPIEIAVKAQMLKIEAHVIRAYEKRTLDDRDRHAAWVARQWDEAGVTEEQRKGIDPPGFARTLEIAAQFLTLNKHRLYVVRPHARATHLARTFLRGDPYQKAEAYAMTRADFDEVFKVVKKFAFGWPGMHHADQLVAQAFERWKQEADAWHRSKEAIAAYLKAGEAARQARAAKLGDVRSDRISRGLPVSDKRAMR